MEKWALAYKDAAHFVCVGCAGPQLAQQMGTRSRLAHCTNGFIARQDQMPRWGQLGCNGFIILDSGAQEVLEASTSPFMQVRELAFKHVEAVLGAVLNQRPPPQVCPGQFVRLTGLEKKKELNGEVCVCIEAADDASDSRCAVRMLKGGRDLRVKASNLKILQNDEEGTGSSEEEDGSGGS